MRRTTVIDTHRDRDGGTIRLVASAEDLVVELNGRRSSETNTLSLSLRADTSDIVEIEGSGHSWLADLAGRRVGAGFRRGLDDLTVPPTAAGSRLFTLLDDLPGAALVSGYATLIDNPPAVNTRTIEYLGRQQNRCAGWAEDATIVVGITLTGGSPTPRGPLVPPRADSAGEDPSPAPLTPRWMRRARRIDVSRRQIDGRAVFAVDSAFRDSHADSAGVETALHDYTLTAVIDAAGLVIDSVEVTARVLPWQECTNAVGSARGVLGMSVDRLRREVHGTLAGRSSCTHLNDTIRVLGDVPILVAQIPPASGPRQQTRTAR